MILENKGGNIVYKMMIPGTNNAMYVNELDQKGISLISRKGMSQPRIVRFWRTAVAGLKPTLVVDAGVNYGEILLSTVYAPKTLIMGIEANQKLSPYIDKSLKEHPNRSQISMTYAFASDKEELYQDFFIDTLRSGNSSAFPLENRPLLKTSIKSIRIDNLFPDRNYSNDRLLFKIDVEGYEWNVLKGMLCMLEGCREYAGCIEFNIAYMENLGIDIESFLGFLQKHFHIYATSESKTLINIRPLSLANLKRYYAKDKKCNDLILLSSNNLIDNLGLRVTPFNL